MRIKTAIVGCGGIHHVHAKELLALEGVELALLCDIRPEAAKASSQLYRAPYCTDFNDVLADKDIGAVHFCTPHFLHAPMAIAAMEAGKAVLLEKPLATTLADAVKVAETQKRTGAQMGVCFQNRYRPVIQRLRDYVRDGSLGKVLGGRAFVTWSRDEAYYTTSDWKGRWATEGGCLDINQMIHTLDLLQWMFGEFSDIKGTIRRHKFTGIIEAEDTAELRLSHEDGADILYYATSAYCEDSCVFIEIVFEKGRVRVEEDLKLFAEDGGIETFAEEIVDDKKKVYWGNGHKMLIADFYRCLLNGEPFPIGPEEGLKTMRMLDRIYHDTEINKL